MILIFKHFLFFIIPNHKSNEEYINKTHNIHFGVCGYVRYRLFLATCVARVQHLRFHFTFQVIFYRILRDFLLLVMFDEHCLIQLQFLAHVGAFFIPFTFELAYCLICLAFIFIFQHFERLKIKISNKRFVLNKN